MSIQYSGGTIVNTTFTSDGTRINLVNNLNTELKNAGWSVISGDGSADVLMKTAVTPAGYAIRFRLYDPAANNCAQFTMKNDGTPSALTSAIGYVFPVNGQDFRIIANKYQFFMFAVGAAVRQTARKIVMGGVPYVPAFVAAAISDDQLGWLTHNGSSDTDTTNTRHTFRDVIASSDANGWYGSSIMNDVLVDYSSNTGAPRIATAPMAYAYSGTDAYRYLDDSLPQVEAIIAWSSTSAANGEQKYVGQLWGAMVLGGQAVGESTISFDGHTFMAITDQSTLDSARQTGTLYVAVD